MKNTIITTSLAAGALAWACSAGATPTLTLNDGLGHTVTVSDGSLHDSNPETGAVTWLGSLGAWKLNVTTGVSKPVIGGAGEPELDLVSVDATSKAGGSLTITLTDTGFMHDGVAKASIGGTSAGGVTFTTWADSTQLTSQTFGKGAFSGASYGNVTAEVPYSLSEQVVLTQRGAGVSSFDANLRVPDGGATAGLLGFGLVAIEGLRRRFAVR